MITCTDIPNRAIGNALFQYAALLAISLRTGHKPVFPLGKDYLHHCGQRIQMLDSGFQIKIDKSPVEHINVQHTIKEIEDNIFTPSLFSIKDNTDIYGYFQDINYFNWCKEFIIDNLQFNPNIKQESEDFFIDNQLVPTECIAVHIRRGDYLNLANHHPVLDLLYYNKTFQLFEKGYKFIIFSDDTQWCQENFNFDNCMVKDQNSNAFIDMCIMSKCHSNIIANSTFSWWAAFLNKNPNKQVIYPSNWFGPAKNINEPNIFFQEWIRI